MRIVNLENFTLFLLEYKISIISSILYLFFSKFDVEYS